MSSFFQDQDETKLKSVVDLMNPTESRTSSSGISNSVTTGEVDAKQDEKDMTSIHLVCAGSSFVDLKVADRWIRARLDSGAEISILSTELYKKLKEKPAKKREVVMQTADKSSVLKGFEIQPIKLQLGSHTFKEKIYVAPITDEMLLGHDLLHHLGVLIDMHSNTLILKCERIPIQTVFKNGKPAVARVTLIKRVVIPPNSAVRVPCKMDAKLKDYFIEPEEAVLKNSVLMPHIVRSSGEEPVVCLVNTTQSFKTFKKKEIIANAYEVESILDENKVSGSTSSHQETDQVQCHKIVQVIEQMQSKEEERELKSTEVDMELETIAGEIPAHLQEMYNSSVKHLDSQQKKYLAKLLCEYADVFAKNDFDLGDFTAIEHSIDTRDAKPIKQHMRRTPACFVNEEEAHLKKMMDAGVIQESVSEWASSPVLIRKRDGSVRWCIDYRALNEVTVKDTFPLPLVEDCLDTLAGNVWFSKLDANSAYWQVKVKEEDRQKTAFLTKFGLFEHVKMGFGLTNAPATFSRVVNLILRGLTWKTILAFLDDILVLGKTFEEHIKNLAEALERFRQYGMKLKPRKCVFFQKEVEFLGRMVSENNLYMASKDIDTVNSWPVPKSSKEVERFLGLANYHRSFVKGFADKSQPLYCLTGKKQFKWGEKEMKAFETLKQALTTPPVLALPNNTDPFILDVDASDIAIGAELLQVQDGTERVVAYSSFSLTPEQKNYCTTRKELLAIVRFTRQFRYYLLGRIFTVRTDHSSLTWLLRFKEPQGQLARWIEELSQYNMIVKHRAGAKHGNADALSRIPDSLAPCSAYIAGIRPVDLPCGGCRYCTRADIQWAKFAEDVDDAVNLTGQERRTTNKVVYNKGAPTEMIDKSVLEDVSRRREIISSSLLVDNLGAEVQEARVQNGEVEVVNQRELEKCLLDTILTVDTVGLQGSEAHFDIIRPGPDNQSHISTCAVGTVVDGSSKRACWGFTLEDLQQEQATDKDLSFILEWLEEQKRPEEGTLFLSSPQAKYYWLNKELFQLIDGVLFRKKLAEDQDLLLVVPDSLKSTALLLHHDIPSSGHQGVARTKPR